MRPSITVRDANHDRVLSVLSSLRAKDGMHCSCQECTNAIVAAALNCLSPHYYVDLQREQESGSHWIMVRRAVLDAIKSTDEQPDRLCSSKLVKARS